MQIHKIQSVKINNSPEQINNPSFKAYSLSPEFKEIIGNDYFLKKGNKDFVQQFKQPFQKIFMNQNYKLSKAATVFVKRMDRLKRTKRWLDKNNDLPQIETLNKFIEQVRNKNDIEVELQCPILDRGIAYLPYKIIGLEDFGTHYAPLSHSATELKTDKYNDRISKKQVTDGTLYFKNCLPCYVLSSTLEDYAVNAARIAQFSAQ
ncbi:MAG: hypothetical protein MJ237_05070 [bacterium]|nr:hypothetical protein [bacterium]